MNNQAYQVRLQEIAWAKAYVDTWYELVNGEMDSEHMFEYAHEIWAEKGSLDPVELAREDFVRWANP